MMVSVAAEQLAFRLSRYKGFATPQRDPHATQCGAKLAAPATPVKAKLTRPFDGKDRIRHYAAGYLHDAVPEPHAFPGPFDRPVFRHRRLPPGRVRCRCAQRSPEPGELPYRARDGATALLPDNRTHLVSPHRLCQLPRGARPGHLSDRGQLRGV